MDIFPITKIFEQINKYTEINKVDNPLRISYAKSLLHSLALKFFSGL